MMPRVVSSCTAGCLPSARAHGRSLLLRGTSPPLLVRSSVCAHSRTLPGCATNAPAAPRKFVPSVRALPRVQILLPLCEAYSFGIFQGVCKNS